MTYLEYKNLKVKYDNAMEKTLRILMVEDLAFDAELVKREIKKSGIPFIDQIVETKDDYLKALQNFKPDLILSDYTLPSFSGLQALLLKEELAPLIPFILVTGSINEETAVEMMKAGADDYIIKDHITRLGTAIIAALEKREIIRSKKEAEDRLRILSQAIEQNPVSILITDISGNIEYANLKYIQISGYSYDEIIGKKLRILKPGSTSPEEHKQIWETITSDNDWHGEFLNRKKNGETYSESITISPISNEKGVIINFLVVKEDITERKHAEAILHASEEKYRFMVEQIIDVVWQITPDWRFTYVSPSDVQQRGYTMDEVFGRTIFEFMTPESALIAQTQIAARQSNMKDSDRFEPLHLEIEQICKNGRRIWTSIISHPMVNAEGRLFGFQGVTRNITESKKAELELIAAKEKAEENDRLKSAFLANMSHEIRTPLNSIIGFSELIIDPDFGSEQHAEFAQVINDNGNNLLAVISDIMDISKIEAGQVQLKKQLVSVNQLINAIQKEYSFKAIEKGIDLQIDPSSPKEEIVIKSDGERLRQILVNFVSNAIKFTEKGSIEIGFRIETGLVKFHVKDSGIGIPTEYHDKIFERFRQVESAYTRKYGGNGLGLPISKSLAELLGGSIWMESESGKGSTFYFTVPITQ